MKLKSLKLVNFRNYTESLVHFADGVNVIYGQNGQGKTNIVEAIYMLALAQSHRTNNDRELVKFNEEQLLIEAVFNDGKLDDVLKIEVRQLAHNKFRKFLYRDDFLLKKYADFLGAFNAVIFAPEDLLLIKEGPALRRQLINRLLSQTNKRYLLLLQQLNSILENRNHLLKELQKENLPVIISLYNTRMQATCAEAEKTAAIANAVSISANSEVISSADNLDNAENTESADRFSYLAKLLQQPAELALATKVDSLLIWNEKFVEVAAKIISYRLALAEKLNVFVKKFHSTLSAEKEELYLYYRTVSSIEPTDTEAVIAEKLRHKLHKSLQQDIFKGHTSQGPQRDDLEFYLNEKNCRLYASQGQQRTAVLALKMAECEYIKEFKHCDPVLILDDVLSELDEDRRSALFASISDNQVFLTCTDLGQFDEKWLKHSQFNYINVINGEII